MSLHFVSGDMWEREADVRVNTVNCVGTWGKGVALHFKNRYPKAFLEHKKACKSGKVRPGDLHIFRVTDCIIVNFPTKRHWAEDSRYEDIEAGLKSLRRLLEPLGKVRVVLPALGCGNGNLEWEKQRGEEGVGVKSMITCFLAGLEAEIYAYSPQDSRR